MTKRLSNLQKSLRAAVREAAQANEPIIVREDGETWLVYPSGCCTQIARSLTTRKDGVA